MLLISFTHFFYLQKTKSHFEAQNICERVPDSFPLSVVCDGSFAVTDDGLPTQEPASRSVAQRPAPQPAQPSSCHAGPCPL